MTQDNNSPVLAEFGRLMRRRREHLGLSLTQLATRTPGLQWTALGHYERGQRNPTLDTVWSIAKALNCSPAELLPLGDLPDNDDLMSDIEQGTSMILNAISRMRHPSS